MLSQAANHQVERQENVTNMNPVPLTPEIYVQGSKVTNDPNRSSSSSSFLDALNELDTTTVLYIVGGIALVIVLVR